MNKKWYKAMYIENNWEPLRWKYTFEELNSKVEEVKNSKWEVVSREYDKLNDFLKEWLEKLNVGDVVKQIESVEKEDDVEEDLPF